MRIVFMGTPEFAVAGLRALLQDGQEVAGVFTQPDRPKGRGNKLTPPPVKEEALRHGLPVFQPKTLRSPEALEILRELAPDMIVVAAYGNILPRDVLTLPKYGCINIHASLLPEYRGASPIQTAILDGKKVTGVTTMFMDEGLDTGDMLMKEETPIGENETADELHDRLALIGAHLLLRTIRAAEEGTLQREKQQDSQSSYAPLLTKERSPLCFDKSARQLHDQVRGLSSWPGATAVLCGKKLKIHRTRVVPGCGQPGQVLSLSPLTVACGEGALEILEVQPEGKKRMTAEAFLNGLHGVRMEELTFC